MTPAAHAAEPPAAPRPVKRVAPDYPEGAWNRGVSGEVVSMLEIDPAGDVTSVAVQSEAPAGYGFGEAAAKALKSWKYAVGIPGQYKVRLKFAYVPPQPEPEQLLYPPAPPPIKRVAPVYPPVALNSGVEGEVNLIITINAEGAVAATRVIAEFPPGFGFADGATKAVAEWRFPPGAPGVYTLEARYKIQGGAGKEQDPVSIRLDKLPDAPEPVRRGKIRFPKKAREAGVDSGVVEMGIQVSASGRITHSDILSETPPGLDFAGAAYISLPNWRFPHDQPGAYRLRIELKDD